MTTLIVIAVIAIMIVAKSLKIVPANQRFVITRLGKFQGVVGPGIVVVLPVFDAVAARYSLDAQELRFPHDRGQLVIHYRVLDPQKAFLGIADVNNAVQQSARTAIESMSGKPLTDVFARRELVSKIDLIVENFGVKVTEAELE